jgi:hypothetical protein
VFTDFEEAGYTTLWHIGTGAGKDRQTMTEQDQLAILHQGRPSIVKCPGGQVKERAREK